MIEQQFECNKASFTSVHVQVDACIKGEAINLVLAAQSPSTMHASNPGFAKTWIKRSSSQPLLFHQVVAEHQQSQQASRV